GLGEERGALLELAPELRAGQTLAEALGLPDAVLELKVTPNRGDCLSLRGLAREVGCLFGIAPRLPASEPVAATAEARLAIRLDPGAGCPRYLGRVVEGLDPAASSPSWLRERLRRSGLRPIHPVVDVTNYVMLELGQPLHAFDLAALAGGIQVRRARPGERIQLLDGREVVLDHELLVIADDDGPVALAGLMGGARSRVREGTTAVFLESAHFAPEAIAGRARRLGLGTDAGHRFERGVDPE
ncbi:MAG: phenylalanine--tRNA ligase beta subunit-related protein, partial [Anaerolineales bacterium]|nr:phenylalanine--tRNA ligase beta subunit-related protein [Anaerolineales bacterium]